MHFLSKYSRYLGFSGYPAAFDFSEKKLTPQKQNSKKKKKINLIKKTGFFLEKVDK